MIATSVNGSLAGLTSAGLASSRKDHGSHAGSAHENCRPVRSAACTNADESGSQVHAWLQVVGHIAQELVCSRLCVEEVVDCKHAGHHIILPCAGREVRLAQLVVAHELGGEVAKVCGTTPDIGTACM